MISSFEASRWEARRRLHIRLEVITEPDPGTRAVFEHGGEGSIFFQGSHGTDSLDCGSCSAPLAVGILRNQFRDVVLKCANCGAFNDT
jgi:hypothetical protein